MKIFGGKARKQSSSPQKGKQRNVNVSTPYDNAPDYDVMGKAAGQKAKGNTGRKDPAGTAGKHPGKKSIVLLVFAIVAFLFAGAAFVAVQFIRAPEIMVHENDKTIIDHENGDAVVIDPGQRISDYFTFLVCATDIDETRTDNIMVVGFDTKNHKVNVLNIPRDVMCSNNRIGSSRKINAAYGSKHDIENTKKEVKKVIGFTPDKYIVVNFKGIAQIVDAVGGIDYEVPFKMIYNDPYQDLNIYFEPGMQHMNGEQVVEFLRWRHNDPGYIHLQGKGYDGGDESRIVKQQEFLMHLAKQILKPSNILKAKPIAEAVFSNVRTDLTMGELVWMANQAMQVDTADIQMFTLPGYPASSYAGNNAYLSFFFPNESKTIELINTHFNPYDKAISSLDVIESPPDGKRRPNVSTNEDEPEYHRPSKDEKKEPVERDPEDSTEEKQETVPPDEGLQPSTPEQGSQGEQSQNPTPDNGTDTTDTPENGENVEGNGNNGGDTSSGQAQGGASSAEGKDNSDAGGDVTPELPATTSDPIVPAEPSMPGDPEN